MRRAWWLSIALGAALLSLAAAPRAGRQDPAAVHTCTLLTPEDAAPLLGSVKKSKGSDDGWLCTWGGAGSGGSNNWALMLTSPPQPPAKAVSNFHQIEAAMLKNHPDRVQKESGMGDEAFSELTSYGCRILILKGGRTLQLQFNTGKPGTAAQLETLRPIAKKAASAM